MAGLTARGLLVLLAAVGWLGSSPGDPAVAAAPWAWPVGGADAVTRPFAPPVHRYGAGHRGVDLLAVPGAEVRAAGGGRVSYAGALAGRGVVVVVHGDLRTTYEPVTATVGLGQRVAVGDVLGRLESGHAGCPALACLHWGLRRGEDYLDPTRLVERGPVRLLPLGAHDRPAAGSPAGPGPATAGPPRSDPARPGPPPPPAAPQSGPALRPSASRGAETTGSTGTVRATVPPLVAAGAAFGLAASLTGLSLHRSRR